MKYWKVLCLVTVVAGILGWQAPKLMPGLPYPKKSLTTSYAPRTYEAFKQIAQMHSYPEITHTFGPPDRDIGSGIFIDVYDLTDGTQILVGTVDRDSLVYVKWHDPKSGKEELIQK